MAAKAPYWEYILTDLQGNIPSGNSAYGQLLNLKEVKCVYPLMRIPTLGFQIPIWSRSAAAILDNDCLVKAYRTDPVTNTRKLVFHGPVIGAEENGSAEAQSVGVTCAGPYWRLQKRIVPGSDAQVGWKYPASGDEDLATLAHLIVTNVNGGGNTGVQVGTKTGTFPRGVAGPWHLKNAGEAIAELGSGLNSFEFDVVPIEPAAGPSFPYIGRMDIAPQIGFVQRTNAIFEYGTTRANVTTYRRTISRDGLANKVYIGSPTWQDTATANGLITRSDSTSITARGVFEDVLSDGGLYDNGIRTQLADEHLLVRKQPRQIVYFTPSVNSRPMPFVDYNLGDFVRARAVVRGSVRFDAMFRIWGITFGRDKNGNESVELELTPP